jgi:hypothetical protein
VAQLGKLPVVAIDAHGNRASTAMPACRCPIIDNRPPRKLR